MAGVRSAGSDVREPDRARYRERSRRSRASDARLAQNRGARWARAPDPCGCVRERAPEAARPCHPEVTMSAHDSTNRAWALFFARAILGLIFFMAGWWKVFQ